MDLLRAVAVAMAAYFLLPSSFPHPYMGVPAEVVSPDALALFPPFPANLSGPFAPNHHLTTRATRMFEGKVSGAESVAVAPDGTLVMLDKYGYVHRARQADSDGDDALHDAGYVTCIGLFHCGYSARARQVMNSAWCGKLTLHKTQTHAIGCSHWPLSTVASV